VSQTIKEDNMNTFTTRSFLSRLGAAAAMLIAGALFAMGLAPAAKADTMENLVFTGTATCESPFAFQECTPGSVGPLTGTYTLDVTTQQIVGPWSFTSPFASFSSSDAGASGTVVDGVIQNGVSYNLAEFQESTPTFLEALTLGFTGAGALSELGAISTPVVITTNGFSGICQNVPGNVPAGCEPDVNIAGSTAIAATPEPGTISLMLAGLLAVLRRRVALRQQQAS
jgi:PEP-CTERM motif-containing protein